MGYEEVDFSLLDESALFDLDLDSVAQEEWEADKPSCSDAQKERHYFQKMKAKWPDIKAALNLWGNKFSQGSTAERAMAAERIFEIFTTATLPYSQMEENSVVYQKAVATMRANFLGEIDHPIRFMSTLCPEEIFMEAVCKTLGWAMGEDADGEVRLLSGAYDHTKGASYVTWFSRTLKWTSSSRRRKLNREFTKNNIIKTDAKALLLADQDTNTIQASAAAHAAPRQQTLVLEKFAQLTTVALQLDKKFSLKSPAKNTYKKINPQYLQLFYSLQLVNFSRHAKDPVSRETDHTLMGAAEKEFLAYSTTILPPCNYPGLVQAELSELVLKGNYYDLQDGEKELQDRVVALYMGIGKSTLSKYFTTIKVYFCENRKELI